MSVPLPNTLTFTAGDPLTAEEMNKMWANDKFLADNINTGKLIIKVNGTVVNNSFNANSASDVNVDLSVPTNVSDLTDATNYAKVADIPTKTSDLVNDGSGTSPFLTAADVPGIPNNGKLTVTVNGTNVGEFTANQATNTTIPLSIPEYVSDLADASDYSTTVQTTQLISDAIAGLAVAKLSYEIVTVLPSSGIDTSTVYMVLQHESGADDYYDQYMYIDNQWAHIGTTEIDLSNYATLADIPTVPAVYDSTITFYKSDGSTLVDSFTTNQSSNKSITLPEGGSSKTVTIKDEDNTTIDSFALNIQTDKTVTLPAATGTTYGLAKVQVSSTDITEGAALDEGTIYGVTGAPASGLLDLLYPVGSIYMNVNNINPGAVFGGTWVQIKDTFLLAAGDTYNAGSTGGAATVKLTSANLPTHTHTYDKSATTTGAASGNTGAASGNTGSTTLTLDQIPSHSHGAGSYAPGGRQGASNDDGGAHGYQWASQTLAQSARGGGQGHTHTLNNHTHTLNSHTHSISLTSTNSGNGGFSNTAHNNMPPYLTVYVWRRTA